MSFFLLPPSPFEREKERVGEGFLAGANSPFEQPPSRSPNPKHYKAHKRVLSAHEREYIGSTTREVSAERLAKVFGIELSYVYTLRAQYRNPGADTKYNRTGRWA